MEPISRVRKSTRVDSSQNFINGLSSSSTSLEDFHTLLVQPGASQSGDFVSPNPWSYSILETTSWTGDYISYRARDSNDADGNPIVVAWTLTRSNGVLDTSVPIANVNFSRAYAKALDRMYSHIRSGVDLSVTLATTGQTSKMFNLIKQAEDIARDARRRSKGKIRALASIWLSLQYAWKPLLSDIFGTLEQLQRTADNTISRYRFTGSDDSSETVTKSIFLGIPRRLELRRIHKVAIQISYRRSDPTVGDFTALNPVSIAWELLPYSFVVDWFVGVGSYVRNLESAYLYSDLQLTNSFVSRLSAQMQTLDYGATIVNPPYENDSVNAKCTVRSITFDRARISTPPFPQTPRFQVDLGSERLLSAASLLGVLLKP